MPVIEKLAVSWRHTIRGSLRSQDGVNDARVEVCAGLFRSSPDPGSFSESGPLRDSGHLSAYEAGACWSTLGRSGYRTCRPLSLAREREDAWSCLGREGESFSGRALQS